MKPHLSKRWGLWYVRRGAECWAYNTLGEARSYAAYLHLLPLS